MAYDIGPRIGIEGESEFRNAIKQINENMKTLGTEMKVVASQFDKNDNSTEALTARSEVLNKQIDEQNNKLSELRKGLEAAAEKYGENDRVTQGWQRAVNQATADLNNFKHELDNTNAEMEKAKNPTEDMTREVKDFGENADNAGKKAFSMGDMIKANLISSAIISGIRTLANSISGLASEALDSADSIQQMADQTGMSAEAVQQWQYVGDTVGTSIDTITGSMSKLIKNMSSASSGSGTAYKAFERLGISVKDSVTGELRNSNDVFAETIGALGNVANETERTAIAQNIFGKSASDLNPLIKTGTDQLKALAQQASDTGAVMSNETVSSLDDFGDTIGQLKTSVLGIAGSILKNLLPAIQPLIAELKDNAPEIAKTLGNIATTVGNLITFLVDNGDTIISVIAAIGTGMLVWNVASMINGLVGAIKAFQLANEGATIAQAALNVVMDANPVGIIITAVAALAAGIIALWNTNEGFRDAVTNIWNGIKDTAVNVFNGIVAFLSKWGLDILTIFAPFIGIPIQIYKNWDGIKDFFSNLFQDIGNIVNNIKSKIINMFTGIKIPHISVDIKWGGPGNAIPYPSFDVNWFAKGGVFNNPAIIGVGEAGKEAVMPLENNTGWISDLASELTNRMGSSSGGNYSFVIPLYIDGKEVARASVKYTSEELARMNRNSKMAYGGA